MLRLFQSIKNFLKAILGLQVPEDNTTLDRKISLKKALEKSRQAETEFVERNLIDPNDAKYQRNDPEERRKVMEEVDAFNKQVMKEADSMICYDPQDDQS